MSLPLVRARKAANEHPALRRRLQQHGCAGTLTGLPTCVTRLPVLTALFTQLADTFILRAAFEKQTRRRGCCHQRVIAISPRAQSGVAPERHPRGSFLHLRTQSICLLQKT